MKIILNDNVVSVERSSIRGGLSSSCSSSTGTRIFDSVELLSGKSESSFIQGIDSSLGIELCHRRWTEKSSAFGISGRVNPGDHQQNQDK